MDVHDGGGSRSCRLRGGGHLVIFSAMHFCGIRKLGEAVIDGILHCDMVQVAGHHLVMRVVMLVMMSGGGSIICHGRNIHQSINLAPLAGTQDLIGDVCSNLASDLARVLLIAVVKAAMAVAHPVLPRLLLAAFNGAPLATPSSFVDGLVLFSLEPVLYAHTVVTASTGGKVAAFDGALGGVGNGGRRRENIINNVNCCLDGILRLFFVHDRAHFLYSRSSLGFIAGAISNGSGTNGSCRFFSCGDGLGGRFVRSVHFWWELSLGSSDDTILDRGHGSLLPRRLVLD